MKSKLRKVFLVLVLLVIVAGIVWVAINASQGKKEAKQNASGLTTIEKVAQSDETEKEVVFMKKIVEWWASKSYGLDVAKIAGIPAVILQRAGENLEELKETSTQNTKNVSNQSLFSPNKFIQVSDPKFEKVKNIINSFDVNNITPLQALQLLAKIKDELK